MTNLHLLLDKSSSSEKFLGRSNGGGLQINDMLKRREQQSYLNQNKELAKANTGLMTKVNLLEKRINDLVQENIWLKKLNYKKDQTTKEVLDEIEKLVYTKFEEILELIKPKASRDDYMPQIIDPEKEKEPTGRKRESVREEIKTKRRQSSYFSSARSSKYTSPSRVQIIEMDMDVGKEKQQSKDSGETAGNTSKTEQQTAQQIAPINTEAVDNSSNRIRTRRKPSVNYRLPSLKSKMRRDDNDNKDADQAMKHKSNSPNADLGQKRRHSPVQGNHQDENQYLKKHLSATKNHNRKVLAEVPQNSRSMNKNKKKILAEVQQNRKHQSLAPDEKDLPIFDFTDTKDLPSRKLFLNNQD